MNKKQSFETDLPDGADIIKVIKQVERLKGVRKAYIVTMQRIRVYFTGTKITPAEIISTALANSHS